jgi:hypothetical protein
MKQRVRFVLYALCLFVLLLFIFGPVVGLRDTGTQARRRHAQEEHERRVEESLKRSVQDAKRTQEWLERSRKEIFGDR